MIGSNIQTLRNDGTSGKRETFHSVHSSVAEARAGLIWLGSQDKLGYLQGRRFLPVRDSAGEPVREVCAFNSTSRQSFGRSLKPLDFTNLVWRRLRASLEAAGRESRNYSKSARARGVPWISQASDLERGASARI